MRQIVCGLFLLLAANLGVAEDASVRKVLAKYHAMLPGDDELSMYRLDWEDSLQTAQQRALKEGRPICLVIIHARYGDITSGHC